MQRICFTLQVRPDRLDDYRAAHRDVWPEMREALTRTGWRNYSLFLRDDGLLIGYFESEVGLEEAIEAMSREPVNARWQSTMAPFFDAGGAHADEALTALEQVFFLP